MRPFRSLSAVFMEISGKLFSNLHKFTVAFMHSPQPARRVRARPEGQQTQRAADGRREGAEGSEGSAQPTGGRKRPEPGASGITQFRTWHRRRRCLRRRRRSRDINQEDTAKDHRIHERPDIKGRAPSNRSRNCSRVPNNAQVLMQVRLPSQA